MTGSRLLCFHIPHVDEKRLMQFQSETFMFKFFRCGVERPKCHKRQKKMEFFLSHCVVGVVHAGKHHQTLFGDQTFYRLATLLGAVWSCLIVLGRFDKIWRPPNIRSNTSCLMGDVLFVWTSKHVRHVHAYHAFLAACNVVSIVWSVFDQTCMYGHSLQHQRIWSPIVCEYSRLSFAPATTFFAFRT